MTQTRVRDGSEYVAELLSLIEFAQEVAKPKAAYSVAFVTERDGDRIQIEGVWFTSQALAHNLETVERVFPFVATCGHEMDKAFSGKGDMLKEFWWDLIKTHLLSAANKHLINHLKGKFHLGKTATMHPGSGDAIVWPIEQQKDLFSLLYDVERELGIHLTESFLMVPNKTISGLLFPTETDFRSCKVCHRENCPSRHAPFDKDLWEEIKHG